MSIAFFIWMNYLLLFLKLENLRSMNKKIQFQEEVSCIMDNLDEVIMTKSDQGLRFCNKNGFNILKNIECAMKQEMLKNQSIDE